MRKLTGPSNPAKKKFWQQAFARQLRHFRIRLRLSEKNEGTWFMHRSCHANASQLSCECIAAVMHIHRSCHANE